MEQLPTACSVCGQQIHLGEQLTPPPDFSRPFHPTSLLLVGHHLAFTILSLLEALLNYLVRELMKAISDTEGSLISISVEMIDQFL